MTKQSVPYRIFYFFNTLFMIVLIIVMLFPYAHTLAKAFNDAADTAMGGLLVIPRKWTLNNFKPLLKDAAVSRGFVISVFSVIGSVIVSLFFDFTAAYAMTKKDLYGRTAIIWFLLIPRYVSGGLIPSFILYSRLGMLNTFWMYVIPGAFSLYNMVIIRTFINSTIPSSLRESARLDGASEWRVLMRIIIPLCKPIIATVSLWTAVSAWNNWTVCLYYITRKNLFNLQYLLVQVLKEQDRLQALLQAALETGEDITELQEKIKVTPDSIQAAQIIITSIPIILVYPFLQKYFIKGVMIGAVKD